MTVGGEVKMVGVRCAAAGGREGVEEWEAGRREGMLHAGVAAGMGEGGGGRKGEEGGWCVVGGIRGMLPTGAAAVCPRRVKT